MSDLQRLNITVIGRVQGVGFRMFVEEHAERLGLTGYVQNDPDNRRRLEVVAEGGRADLEAFLKLVERGPSMARVESVQTGWEAAQSNFSSFSTTYS